MSKVPEYESLRDAQIWFVDRETGEPMFRYTGTAALYAALDQLVKYQRLVEGTN